MQENVRNCTLVSKMLSWDDLTITGKSYSWHKHWKHWKQDKKQRPQSDGALCAHVRYRLKPKFHLARHITM